MTLLGGEPAQQQHTLLNGDFSDRVARISIIVIHDDRVLQDSCMRIADT